MQSRFEFLDNQFPKLAGFGKRAEESLGRDNNICLLSLGRIGEYITEMICRHNRIDYDSNAVNSAHELLKLGLIDEDICIKIEALIETREDAFTSEYSSEMACNRLLTAAQELCKWFASTWGHSRFDFLADLFKPSISSPPLADLADLGREAEENLYHNTRYCLICLGDIGEAIVDMLIDIRDIDTNDKEQIDKIRTLFHCGVLSDPQKDILHALRMARNKAVHNRYASDEEGRRLLENSLPLCEWMFRFVMSSGDVVRGNITGINEEAITVSIGCMNGIVPSDEIPSDISSYSVGERRNFRVINAESEDMTLSITQLKKNPWLVSARHYARYSIGQDVNAIVRRITSAFGAFVELKDGLKARVPETEYSTDSQKPALRVGQHIMARVKWLNPEQYPYMLLSIKDAENSCEETALHEPEVKKESSAVKSKHSSRLLKKKAAMNKLFLDICRKSPAYEVSNALKNGADIHAVNKNNMTALMMAAMYNREPEVINVLINAGAAVNAQNKNGNTALIFAAKQNTPEVLRALCENNADVTITNNDGHDALYYARSNPKVNAASELMLLLGAEETVEAEPENNNDSGIEAPKEDSNITEQQAPEVENSLAENFEDEQQKKSLYILRNSLQPDILRICKTGDADDVSQAIEAGVSFNVRNKSAATPLMFAAQKNSAEIVDMLIHAGLELNAQDVHGNTALIYAASYNNGDVVEALLNAGAEMNITNNAGYKALDYARRNYRLKDSNALARLEDENQTE